MKRLFYESGTLNWMYVFFAITIGGFLVGFFSSMFTGGASITFFAIHSGDALSILKLWKLFTYGFLDAQVFSVVSNLIWLWIFGGVIEMMLSGKRVFALAVLTLIVMGVLAGLACLLLPRNSFYIMFNGIDVAVVAVAAAAVYKFPQFRLNMMLIGSIPLWILGVVFILLRVFINPAPEFAATLVLYFMAIAFGVLFMYQLYSGKDLTELVFNPKDFFGFKRKTRVVPLKRTYPETQTPMSATDNSNQLDAILDKISKGGMNSLTKAERIFLENYSGK